MSTIKIEQKSNAYKGLDLQWKVVDQDEGIIRGYLAVFNNVDSYNDRIRPGAFKKTITDALQRKDKRGKKFLWPLLWMHDPEKPIGGFIDATEDKTGLLVTAQLDITTNAQGMPLNPLAMSVFSGFKMGYIDELSIGYKAIQKGYEQGTGIRDLTEIQNYEGSAVTMNFAANDLAQVSTVKTHKGSTVDKKDFNDRYREQCIQDWMYSDFNNLMQALKGSVMDIFMVGDTPQTDVLSTILNTSTENKVGFVSALEAYVQKGIDLDVSNYLSEQQNGPSSVYSSSYMSADTTLDTKAGAAISKANADRLNGHVGVLMQAKAMLSTVAEDVAHYITGGPAYVTDSDKTTHFEPLQKALNSEQPPASTDEDEALKQFYNFLSGELHK